MNNRMCAIRPVRAADVPGVMHLIREVYAEYGQVLNTEEEPHVLAPGEYFRARRGEFWVAESEGNVIATCGVKIVDDEAELKTLYVHRAFRRQGLAARLVEHAVHQARTSGAQRLILWSDTRFQEAHRFYRRLGFTLDGLRELRDSNLTWEFGFFRRL